MRSFSISIFIDIFVLEVGAALFFGAHVLLYGYCKVGNWALCLVVILEVYRFYRNLSKDDS